MLLTRVHLSPRRVCPQATPVIPVPMPDLTFAIQGNKTSRILFNLTPIRGKANPFEIRQRGSRIDEHMPKSTLRINNHFSITDALEKRSHSTRIESFRRPLRPELEPLPCPIVDQPGGHARNREHSRHPPTCPSQQTGDRLCARVVLKSESQRDPEEYRQSDEPKQLSRRHKIDVSGKRGYHPSNPKSRN